MRRRGRKGRLCRGGATPVVQGGYRQSSLMLAVRFGPVNVGRGSDLSPSAAAFCEFFCTAFAPEVWPIGCYGENPPRLWLQSR